MIISANLLCPGQQLKVARSKYDVLKVTNEIGLTRVIFKTNKGIVKSRAYGANDKVKIW